MKKHHAKSLEIRFSEPEAFAFAVQVAVDGDRIAADKAKSETDRKESEKQQLTLV